MEFIANILGIYISSIIMSYCMDITIVLKLLKDLADEGYKINIKRIKDINSQLITNQKENTLNSKLIPIYNIINSMELTVKYNTQKEEILNQFYVLDILEEMDEFEKEEYKKNPSLLNSLIVYKKSEERLNNAQILKYKTENEESEIYYLFNEDYTDITILKTTGAASKLTTKEQKEKVTEAWKIITEQYNNKETFMQELTKNETIYIKKQEDILDTKKQKQALENYKEELLKESNINNEIQSTNNKTKKLTKNNNKL